MAKIAAARRRGSSRGSSTRPGRRFLTIAVSAFVGVNLFLLLRTSLRAPTQLHDNARSGEGAHRYRQTEEVVSTAAGDLATVAAEVKDVATDAAAAAAAAAGDAQQGGTQAQAASTTQPCNAEEHAEYDGETVVQWGDKHYKDSAEECCAACQAQAPKCNIWVYCAAAAGCPGGRQPKECWLKHSDHLDPDKPKGRRSAELGWTSGTVVTEEERQAAASAAAASANKEQAYLDGLRNDERLPMVFLDVEIKGQPVGRIEMVLFTDVSPRAAENFRQLCTGESGVVPTEPPGREGAGKARHFKGRPFYRIIDQFIDQTGVETESVFGGQFKDDPGGLKLKHEHKGLLSMANMGHDTNTAHFSIMMGPAPHLNGDYTIFGQVVSGFQVVDAINALSKGKKDNTATAEDGAVITDSGQLRKGTLEPDLNLGLR
ncbi:hypothetical protein D9Q98_008135 [Chlorella vulgaris]|uniref:PPIase cyclophilin-type domain-containing protein n=1 Tax=Chlorella vulgaris TaxID=3077 RepID=A0A9D4YST3_CHLVU|nr:hypothetical protein D9Q98_008135 [Chlorella vulgaris]